MPFPPGVPSVRVTYTHRVPAGGEPARGAVRFEPNVPVLSLEGEDFTWAGGENFLMDEDGTATADLLPTDLEGVSPTGWAWRAVVAVLGEETRSFYFMLPLAGGPLDLTDIAPIDPDVPDYGEGTQGPPGPAGPQGEAGPQGPAGPAGPAGADGEDGSDGATGPAGATGVQGPAGADGAPGADGEQGPQGIQGVQGPAGPAGTDGEDGAPGATGPAGPAGEDGSPGTDGAEGPQGEQGPQGTQGVQGVQGPAGPAGAEGPQGPAGVDGEDGAPGATGSQGPAGDTGPEGPEGPQGPAGADGATGATGPAGADGADGSDAPRWHRWMFPDATAATALASVAPTVETVQGSTPVSGYILYRPPGVTLGGGEFTGAFGFRGAAEITPMAGASPLPTYVVANSKYPHTELSQSVLAVEFTTDAAAFQWRHRHMTAVAGYRIFVDDRPLTEAPVVTTATSAGSTYLTTVTFSAAALRKIRLELFYMPFGGIYVPPTATVQGVPARGPRIMVLGDSISDGSDQNSAQGAGTWFYRTARQLGCTDAWEQAKGGTGYTAAGTSATFGNRVAGDVVAYSPEVLIIWGGVNDTGASLPTIASAAAGVYSAVAAELPDCMTFVVGCWDAQGTAGTTVVNLDNTLRTEATAAGFPFISPITGSVYNAAGTLVETHGPWMRPAQVAGYIGDSVHPNNAGHAYVARRMTAAITALMPT